MFVSQLHQSSPLTWQMKKLRLYDERGRARAQTGASGRTPFLPIGPGSRRHSREGRGAPMS